MTKLSKAASSLIYRLRSRGYRIDTKKRTIFVASTRITKFPICRRSNACDVSLDFKSSHLLPTTHNGQGYISLDQSRTTTLMSERLSLRMQKRNYVRWVCFPSIPWTIAFRSQETGATTCALTLPTSSAASTSTSSQTGNTLKAVASNSM